MISKMWSESIVLVVFLKIAGVLTSEIDGDALNVNRLIDKEYKLIFVKETWHAADQYCTDHNMQLASVNSHEEQSSLSLLLKDENMDDVRFWISKAIVADKGYLKWFEIEHKHVSLKWNLSNQCVFWYWMNLELCFELRPLANEWNYDMCNETKYFICESVPSQDEGVLSKTIENKSHNLVGNELVQFIEAELVKLADDKMLLEFAELLSTFTEDSWITLVKSGLQMWFDEHHQSHKPISIIHLKALSLSDEITETIEILQNNKLIQFVKNKFELLQEHETTPLLNERFRKFLETEYFIVAEKAKLASENSGKSIYEEMISLLMERVIMAAKAKQDDLAKFLFGKIIETKPPEVLDEGIIKEIGQDLARSNEEEFNKYVAEVTEYLAEWGVKELDENILLQMYLLVKQELLAVVGKAAFNSTLEERVAIADNGLFRILQGNIFKPTGRESIFKRIFILLASEVAMLANRFVGFDDVDVRTFVRNEFNALSDEEVMYLAYEGYIRLMVDEFVKLAVEPKAAANESGKLNLSHLANLLASQLFWWAYEEVKVVAEIVTNLRTEESLRIMTMFSTWGVDKYDENNMLVLFQLAEQELMITAGESLSKFSQQEMMEFAEIGLTKILAEEVFKSKEENSEFMKYFKMIGMELSEVTSEEFANLNNDQLYMFVKLKLETMTEEGLAELINEVALKMAAEEFIILIEEGLTTLIETESGKHQFGEMVRLLAERLTKKTKAQVVDIAFEASW